MKFEYESQNVIWFDVESGTSKGYQEKADSILKERGDNGWELCSIIDSPYLINTYIFYFKRRIK